MKHRSGSPRAQQERRQAYRKQSGPVSNPGQPSPTRRKMRRWTKFVVNATTQEQPNVAQSE